MVLVVKPVVEAKEFDKVATIVGTAGAALSASLMILPPGT